MTIKIKFNRKIKIYLQKYIYRERTIYLNITNEKIILFLTTRIDLLFKVKLRLFLIIYFDQILTI